MAITIHKSQGGSFDEVVYEYEKKTFFIVTLRSIVACY